MLKKENEYIFKTTTLKHFREGFRKQRNRLAIKLANPEIKKINFKSLRHFYATRLGRQQVNISTIKYALGHKSTKHTERYIHIDSFPENDTYTVEKILTADEAIKLIEQGYTYENTTPDGFMLYKKRK